jgi:hypothetical protein
MKHLTPLPKPQIVTDIFIRLSAFFHMWFARESGLLATISMQLLLIENRITLVVSTSISDEKFLICCPRGNQLWVRRSPVNDFSNTGPISDFYLYPVTGDKDVDERTFKIIFGEMLKVFTTPLQVTKGAESDKVIH